ncbi:ProQ/FINO family protein [Variovorax dokdonensis]|uniref:ProQ/FINO family protein n=1 Tax=Variovorax dokdonensis TaxID=344883 RepID=A0ABT7NBB4_9BURK|nr:ProQ/FINO family protein [Variovorax dokdonensis]MDM0045222.1 ProQ/FINO family protein [Variovorax dokdonensis]
MTDATDNIVPTTVPQAPASEPEVTAAAAAEVVAAAEGDSNAEPNRRRRSRRGGKGRNRAAGQDAGAAQGKDASAPAAAAAPSGKPREQRQARAGAKPNPVLERLFQLYPGLFGARFLPLKRGVYEDIVARHGSEFEPEALKAAMGIHARSTRYLECVAAGLPRHDLEGQVVEPMAPEHVHHALMEVYKRRRLRNGQDVSDELRARLVKAIEASGLRRDEYQLRMRTRDEAANALLDDAVAEAGRLAARREAMLRAFEASGKDEAQFADMYGMTHKDAARLLAGARRDRAMAATPSEAPTEAPSSPADDADAAASSPVPDQAA